MWLLSGIYAFSFNLLDLCKVYGKVYGIYGIYEILEINEMQRKLYRRLLTANKDIKSDPM